MWSLWLGRPSVFGNTPFVVVETQGYFQSSLQLPSFVWKTAHQKMGCGAESGVGRHSCTAQGENEILTCSFCYLPGSHTVTAFSLYSGLYGGYRAGLCFQVVVATPVPQWPQLNAPQVLPFIAVFQITPHFIQQTKMFRLNLPIQKKILLSLKQLNQFSRAEKGNLHNFFNSREASSRVLCDWASWFVASWKQVLRLCQHCSVKEWRTECKHQSPIFCTA